MRDNDKIQVRCSDDQMVAYILVPKPAPETIYRISDLEEALHAKGVTEGIDRGVLADMIDCERYGVEVRAAFGKEPVDGKDGYFEYFFNRSFNKKPKIKEDGTADYWNMQVIEQVHEGQVIACYHPAVQGEPGVTVKGAVRTGHRGRELPPLKGKGFERSEDNLTYTSVLDGKIEMVNDRITILSTYEISGDVDLSIGNIDFAGDVIIHGGVPSGIEIHASGNIMIDGVVDAACLDAGKDIILRSGMLGGQRATVRTKSNFFAKFCEYTTIDVAGCVEADVLLECQVHCGELVTMNGKRGKIVGGYVQAVRGVDAAELGNQAEVPTHICVGASLETMQRVNVLSKKVEATKENLDLIEEKLAEYMEMELQTGKSYQNDPRRLQLLRMKIQHTASLAKDRGELGELNGILDRAKDATIRARSTVFPGVIIHLNDAKTIVKYPTKNTEYVLNRDHISSCSRGDEIGA